MRVLIAGLIGGIVFFVWGAVAHTVLPIGEMGMAAVDTEDAVLTVLGENLSGEGIYMIPGVAPDKREDAAAVAAYSQKAKVSPFAFVVFQPQGKDGMDMTGNLVKQFASDTLSALIVAFILALGTFGFAKRAFIATALGLFSWLTISVPYWNWYRFPLNFTLGNLVEQVLGWLIAGMAIAWWLGRKAR